MKKLSTTALAKQLNIPTKDLFAKLMKLNCIQKADKTWELTDIGSTAGGEYRDSKEYGRFIVWPSNLKITDQSKSQTITATAIGKHFSISANKTNFILSELGWLKKDVKGWVATVQGLRLGAVQAEDRNSGVPYVRWPESITASKALIQTMNSVSGHGDTNEEDIKSSSEPTETGFRHKFEAKHRATDGHFVRSKAEMLIDNYLYMTEIVHAYERKLPIEEDAYCDFYLPTKKVYIEYWGYDNDQKYLARKKAKIALYEKYGFNLIQLEDKHVQNLDDVLPRLLLKYGIKAY